MNVRALLQKEVWSKSTTRKILLVLGVLVIAFVVCNGLNRYWMTPMERSAGREALEQIESLQSFSSEDEGKYDVRHKAAEAKVQAAEQEAWTSKDRIIAESLSNYLALLDVDRSRQRISLSKNELIRKSSLQDPQLAHVSQIVRQLLSQSLHKVLG